MKGRPALSELFKKPLHEIAEHAHTGWDCDGPNETDEDHIKRLLSVCTVVSHGLFRVVELADARVRRI